MLHCNLINFAYFSLIFSFWGVLKASKDPSWVINIYLLTNTLSGKIKCCLKTKESRERNFQIFQFFFFVNKMYANHLEVLTTYKYLFWKYSGAIITKIKLSSNDHVPAIGKNPGKMEILYPIFTFLVFLKN